MTTGKIAISAETCLEVRNGKVILDESVITDEATETNKRTKQLVALVLDKSKFESMRINSEYSGEFITCVNLCLVHFTTSQTWRYKFYNTYISNIFTATDEALEILLIENNVDDYQRIISMKRKLTRKESKLKYTKADKLNDKFRGWYKKGITRYNELVQIVIINRGIAKSK